MPGRRARLFTAALAVHTALILLLCLALPGLASDKAPSSGSAVGKSPESGLTVESITPTGQVDRLVQVVVRFSQPMHALGDMSQDPAGAPLKLNPRPKGQYRWLDPQTLAYILEEPVDYAASFDITVPAGATSLNGQTLGQDLRKQVNTPPLAWTRVRPRHKSVVGPEPQFTLTFNQAVDLKSLKKKLSLTVDGKPVAIKIKATTRRTGGRVALARNYLVRPVVRLGPGHQLVLKAAKGLLPAQGKMPMPKNYVARFTSYQPLSLSEWRMGKTPRNFFNPLEDLVLEFNNPVEPRELQKHLKITPTVKTDYLSDHDYQTSTVYLDLDFQPRTTYKVELLPGLKDIHGTTLATGSILELPMGDLPPVFSLGSDKGVLESGLEAVYPLKVRNLDKVKAIARILSPEEVVPALRAEDERHWNEPPKEPKGGPESVKTSTLDFSKKPANQLQVAPLDLTKLAGRSPQGSLLLLDLRTVLPEKKGKTRLEIRRGFLQVTDLGLSLKVGENSGLVWVTRLSSGEPLSGVALELRDRTNKVLWQGTSNAQGLAELPGLDKLNPAKEPKRPWRDPQVYLLARHQGQLSVLPSSWASDLLYSMNENVEYRQPGSGGNLRAHAITQLPLYQPGQHVRFAIYLREDGPKGLATPAPADCQVVVMDAYGAEAKKFSGKSNAYGSFTGDLQLSGSARLGTYDIKVKLGDQEVTAGSFRVASFRPPDFKVELTAPAESLGGASEGQARVTAMYHFGAPLTGAQAQLRISQAAADFAPARLRGYAVGDLPLPQQDTDLSKFLGESQAGLDKNGQAGMAIPTAKTSPGQPVRLRLEAQVGDQSQRVVVDTASQLVHPSALYLGIKGPYLVRAGKAARFQVAAATYQNQPVDSAEVTLIAYRQIWETVREKGPGGFFQYLSQARREEVWRGQSTVGAEPSVTEFTPAKTGTYLLVAEAKDQKGRATRSAAYFYASGSDPAGWRRFDDNRLELVADDQPLAPGQKARVMIKNPFAQAYACISLERSGLRQVMIQKVSGPAPMVEVPISAVDAPQTYLSVLLVRGRSAEPPTAQGPDLGKPQVRLGYAVLKVKDPDTGLKVEVTTDRAKVEPGQSVKARVSVKDMSGRAQRAEVTFLAVDERVLTAAGNQTNYDPRQTFDRPSQLAVLSADTRTQVLGRRFYAKKGEDGAGGGGVEPALRQRFHPAVFWLAQAETDQNGVLSAEIKLPDTLTAYRVVAVAAGKGRNFGLGRAKVVATRPLQILSALPRFAVLGDEFSARVLVQNLSKAPGQVTVTAGASGLVLTGAKSQTIELAAGETRAVGFPVSADHIGQAALTFSARLGSDRDRVRYTLEIAPPSRLSHAAAAGALDPASGRGQAMVPLKLPAQAAPNRGGLTVTVAPSLAASLKDPAQAVLTYPWDCLEQRMSKAAVRAFILEQGPRWGFQPQPGDKQRLMDEALAKTIDYQTGGGAFTFWPGSDRADLFLTAYTMIAAKRIAAAGQEMPAVVRDQALGYLQRYLRHSKPPKENRLPERLGEALAVLALAEHGRPAQDACRQVVTRSQGLPPFGLAALLEASHLLKLPDLQPELIRKLEATAATSATELHFGAVNPGGLKEVMGSSLRGNAFALAALSHCRPDYSRLDALARWVAARLGESTWLTTQEGVFGLWGLSAYLGRITGPTDLDVALSLGDKQLLKHHYNQANQPPITVEVVGSLMAPGQPLDLGLTAAGNGMPHWTARLNWAAPRTPVQPVTAGFNLSRAYRVVNSANTPALGDEVEVTLTVHVEEARHHVLVHDPFPAGLEPPRPAAGAPEGGPGDRGWVWQWRELHTTRLLLYAPKLAPGVYTFSYTLRAVAPGRFVTRAAQVEEMYTPEVFARTAGGEMLIRE